MVPNKKITNKSITVIEVREPNRIPQPKVFNFSVFLTINPRKRLTTKIRIIWEKLSRSLSVYTATKCKARVNNK
jgi:hypothetical protein